MAGKFSLDKIIGSVRTSAASPAPVQAPAEATALSQQLVADAAAVQTQRAEQVVKGLPPGSRLMLCPDATCSCRWVGPPGSEAEKSYKTHLERHHHARHPVVRREGVSAA